MNQRSKQIQPKRRKNRNNDIPKYRIRKYIRDLNRSPFDMRNILNAFKGKEKRSKLKSTIPRQPKRAIIHLRYSHVQSYNM